MLDKQVVFLFVGPVMSVLNGLTHAELSALKRTLKKREHALREAMHAEFVQRSADGGSGSVQYHESTDDEAIVDVLNDVAVKSMADYASALNEIESSLAAIAAGKYGICSSCGEPIGHTRLNANPVATRCIRCQTRHEGSTLHHPSL